MGAVCYVNDLEVRVSTICRIVVFLKRGVGMSVREVLTAGSSGGGGRGGGGGADVGSPVDNHKVGRYTTSRKKNRSAAARLVCAGISTVIAGA